MSRALAIARSHADAGVAALLVVGTDGRQWAAHHVAGAGAASATVALRGDAATVLTGLGALARRADLVVVDAPAEVAPVALRMVAPQVGKARLMAADLALLDRFGNRRPVPGPGGHESPLIEPFRASRARRWPAVLAAAAVLGVVATAAVILRPTPARGTAVVVGGVRVDVPAGWRSTELVGEPAPRVVFVDPGSGNRIIVAVTPLRAGASAESVAASLAERIRQRGDDAVSEFAARAQFAGHAVTAYRETPDSGAPIRWYVRVVQAEGGRLVQASIGCQDAGSAVLETACRRAVTSAGRGG